jgi:hypothetical protein
MKNDNIKVLWIKAHWDFAYSAGDTGFVKPDKLSMLVNGGFVIPLPDDLDNAENPLPVDLPGRDKLFEAGFDTIEKIKTAGDSIIDAGISNTIAKKVIAYLKD